MTAADLIAYAATHPWPVAGGATLLALIPLGVIWRQLHTSRGVVYEGWDMPTNELVLYQPRHRRATKRRKGGTR